MKTTLWSKSKTSNELTCFRMHMKYFDVIEYFRESKLTKEVEQTTKEFQKFDETFQDIDYLLNRLNFKTLDADV